MNPTVLEAYGNRFRSLRCDRELGRPRPHKAVMLLSVISLIESGRLASNRIVYDTDLTQIFARFFELVRSGSDKFTPFNPFFHLKSEGFWHLHAVPGQEAVLSAISTIRGRGQLESVVAYASLEEPLFILLANPTAREFLRKTLIETYFPHRAAEVLSASLDESAISSAQQMLEKGNTSAGPAVAEAIRDAAFGRTVRKVYDYTCALCGIRFVCDDVVLVDAAHLIPFAESRNDSPSNGIALCKNHHWLMDKFLVAPGPGPDGDYAHPIWHISDALDSRLEAHRACMEYKRRPLLLPRDHQFHPMQTALDWRMEHLRVG